MKKSFALISSLVIAVLILFSSAHAEESQIVVSATGTVSVKPDMAGFTIVLTSLGGNAEKASSEIAERYRSVQQALRTAGIAPDDATSASFSVAPEFVWDQAGARNVLKGYQARHVITVTVRDLRMVGKAIDAVIHAGANDIQNVRFFSGRHEALRRQALAIAVENARKDAEIMAGAAGGRLGQPLELKVEQSMFRGGMAMEMMDSKALRAPAPTELAPSEQEIEIRVFSRWKFTAPVRK